MIETDADRLASIKGLGGQLVSHDLGEFWAIFDNDYFAAIGDGRIDSKTPGLTCRTSDVANLSRQTSLRIGDVLYKLTKAEPDGTGMTVLLLGR